MSSEIYYQSKLSPKTFLIAEDDYESQSNEILIEEPNIAKEMIEIIKNSRTFTLYKCIEDKVVPEYVKSAWILFNNSELNPREFYYWMELFRNYGYISDESIYIETLLNDLFHPEESNDVHQSQEPDNIHPEEHDILSKVLSIIKNNNDKTLYKGINYTNIPEEIRSAWTLFNKYDVNPKEYFFWIHLFKYYGYISQHSLYTEVLLKDLSN